MPNQHNQYNRDSSECQKISVIIPVIRVEKAIKCIASVHQRAGVPREQFEILTEIDRGKLGCPLMVQYLTAKAQYDLVMFLGDDTTIEQDCLKNALAAMSKLPDGWGLAGLNDGFNGPDLPTHWLAHKKLLPLLGGEFFHTGYRHTWCDKELWMRCNGLGRYVWAEDARITHDHPAMRGEPTQGTSYEWQYALHNFYHDRRLFRERMARGWA